MIIPTYNSERFLGAAIQSVLAQTYQNFEILIVDDGSTDQTYELVTKYKDPRIKYIYQANRGLPAARNRGLQSAGGDYLVFLDSDDALLPQKLAIQVDFLVKNPTVSVICGGFEYINSDCEVIKNLCNSFLSSATRELNINDIFWYGMNGPIHSAMLKSHAVDVIGGFDETLHAWEDMEFWFRLGLTGCKIMKNDEPVCQYRIHGENMTSRVDDHLVWCIKYLEKVFENPMTPEMIHDQRNTRYASEYLHFSGRYYAAGMPVKGGQAITNAVRYDHRCMEKNNLNVPDKLASIAFSIWVSDPEIYLKTLADSLPGQFPNGKEWTNEVRIHVLKRQFYTAYDHRQFDRIPTLWMRILKLQPGWIFNRGGISIFLQSVNLRSTK